MNISCNAMIIRVCALCCLSVGMSSCGKAMEYIFPSKVWERTASVDQGRSYEEYYKTYQNPRRSTVKNISAERAEMLDPQKVQKFGQFLKMDPIEGGREKDREDPYHIGASPPPEETDSRYRNVYQLTANANEEGASVYSAESSQEPEYKRNQDRKSIESSFRQRPYSESYGYKAPTDLAKGKPAGVYGNRPVDFGGNQSTDSYGGQPAGTYGNQPSGVYGGQPSGTYGNQPSGRRPVNNYGGQSASAYGSQPAGAYGNQPAGAYGSQPSGSYDGQPASAYGSQSAGSYGGQPSGRRSVNNYGGQPAGVYGNQPAGAYGGQPTGAYGGQPSGRRSVNTYGGQPAGVYGNQPAGVDGGRSADSYGDHFGYNPSVDLYNKPSTSSFNYSPTEDLYNEQSSANSYGYKTSNGSRGRKPYIKNDRSVDESLF